MADQSEKTSLKQLFQGMTGGEVDVLQGIVKAASPLRIQIVNDEKLTISSNITYVPRHLTNYTTTADISGDGISVKGAKVTVNNALQTGETVHVLSLKNGKQYYVLDRIS